ncbi:MAG: hypothetical protein EBT06_01850 [Gammaproteobacteria bacterium]|nr:hypothetical protein [Gammaproteobacteria bacterium]NBT43663.1 hypothetical protein [Gammaproteobacteria bacterium]NBY23789.1 hypothetical protein [Gammaproteobacteria bacterium]NDE33404.1 hypothetical protein [Gammaproteobacteria bacterium]NDE55593.1 hypothetical protein [Gammaproteobacteria bacterium]
MKIKASLTSLLPLVALTVSSSLIGHASSAFGHGGLTNDNASAYGATALYIQLPCASGQPAPCTSGSTHELSFSKNGKHLWVTQMTSFKIFHFDVVGGEVVTDSIKTFVIPNQRQPHGIVSEGDHAWATLEIPSTNNALIKIDSNGNILQEIPLSSGTSPHGLDVAKDGILWFAGKGDPDTGVGAAVGSANPITGVSRYFPLETGSKPIYVHVTNTNDVWFTELVGSRIGRIREGRITEINLPTPNSRPISIDSAPNGSVYFTLEAANSLGYLPSKVALGPSSGLKTSVVQQRFVSTVGVKPAGGTITPTGQVWFGAGAVDEMIKLNKPNTLIQIPQGSQGSTYHRSAYMGHKIFWTELSTDRIGYLKGVH